MANFMKTAVWAMLGIIAITSLAQAMPLNRCAQLVRDQTGREAIVNTCNACIAVKVERRRPGQNLGTPNLRDFLIPPGSNQLLPFRGPGVTRIMSQDACPTAGRQ